MKHLIFILLFSSVLMSCKKQNEDTSSSSYKTMVVGTSNRMLQSDYAATVTGRQYVEIRPQVSGTITKICINEGAAVRKGQLLFIIDQVPYKAALQTARANVETARAKLATAKLTASSKEELYKEKVVSAYDLQTARNAKAEAEAALAQARAEEVNARNNLSYTEVRSPVNGVASMIPYKVGALVNSSISEPLVTVSDDSSVYAYFSMAESQVLDLLQQYGSLQEAMKKMPEVELEMSNGKMFSHKGRIDAISGTVDSGTGSVSLRAVFPNSGNILRNGSSGRVILPSVHSNCIVIPQTATYEIQNKIFVYKVVNGYTKSSSIEVFKLNNGTEYIVESGLAVGDTIIAEGAGLAKEGIKVESTKK